MKFILSENGDEAINLSSVKSFAIERVVYKDGAGNESRVVALLNDDSTVVIKIFDSVYADENFTAAKKYLAELVAELNGGTQ